GYLDSPDLNFSNRPVRTRMPGGVAGEQSSWTAPYADLRRLIRCVLAFMLAALRVGSRQGAVPAVA
ncbi:hypothetical protein WKW77_34140, partial [Variovorax ureilyticus]